MVPAVVIAFGACLFLGALWLYLGTGLERLRRNVLIRVMPGPIYGGIPTSLACVVLGVSSLFHGFLFELLFWLAGILGVIAFTLWFWHPDWVRPYWMRGPFGD